MCVHLTTNASFLNGVPTFQRAVFLIHSLGDVLPIVEWGAIFAPLLFHAVLGVWIIKTGKSNDDRYNFTANKRYKWQRWTGLVAFVYLMVHVLHLHGWFHAEAWLNVINRIGLGGFKPYNAGSTLVRQMDGIVWPAFYLAGVMACVYHFANGLWTAGITWGLWISPKAQARATKVCVALGLGLAVIGTGAWWAAVGPSMEDADQMELVENEMYEANLEAGLVYDKPEKRSKPATADDNGELAPGTAMIYEIEPESR